MATVPSLALIPSAYKASKVYSVLPSNGDGDFTFTRPSSATRVNSNGLIETVGVNVPRLDYSDGGCPSLLLEPQRTNSILYSEDFSQSVYAEIRASLDNNAFLAPNGLMTAGKLIEDTSVNSSHYMYYNPLFGAANRTVSVFLKNAGRRYVTMLLTNGTDGTRGQTWFDLEDGVVVSGLGKIQDYGNGWYRCSISGTSTTNDRFDIRLSFDGVSQTYTGNGVDGVYIWGLQAEEGSYPTSYIPTNGSIATRIVETCNNAGNASTFNDSEGVLFIEASALVAGSDSQITLSDGTNNNVIILRFDANINRLLFYIRGNGGTYAIDNIIGVTQTDSNKIALVWDAINLTIWLNGVESNTVAVNDLPIGLNRINLSDATSSSNFFGKVKQLQYFDTALTDQELIALTSL